MSENEAVLVAIIALVALLAVVGVLFLSGMLLRTFSAETRKMFVQQNLRDSAKDCLVEKFFSRMQAICFPNGFKLYRDNAGPVIDGAQQQPKFVDELDVALELRGRGNGTVRPAPVTEDEMEP